MRATRAEVDLGAIRHNVGALAAAVAPAALCAVVKADGYGHGSIAVGTAALEAGARWLAVALVEEAAVLRKAGVTAPILLLSEPRPTDVAAAVRYDLRTTVYTREGLARLAGAATAAGATVKVHVKANTGMNRVGAAPEDVLDLIEHATSMTGIEVEALWTHCAVADEPANAFTDEQLDRFDALVGRLDARGLRPPLLHAANSAVAIDHARGHYDLVRAGIACYGLDPSPALRGRLPLRPALSLRAEVSFVKRVPAGEAVSYGLRAFALSDTVVATVPIGYADGVPRALGAVGGVVLIGGSARPIIGTVTMDQLMVDCGPEGDVAVGDEVVLLGAQGAATVEAADWAAATGTIAYEIVCGIGPRVPRWYVGG